MSQILNKIRDVDPNDSEAVKGTLMTFFQNLSKHTKVDCNLWLCSLENVLNRFPKYCSSQRGTIEKYLTSFLGSTNYYHVIGAAKCAHAVQQIKPSQDKESTPKACWREQMNILCNAAHSLIESIFAKTLIIYKNNVDAEKQDAKLLANMPLSSVLLRIQKVKAHDTDGKSKKEILTTRLRNVLVFIQAMLVEIYPVAKPIRPQLILEVIVQALSVSSGVGNDNLCDVTAVKTEALRLLDALVLCMGSNLIPFSALVFRCMMQTLRWSSENSSEEASKVRCSAYNSLSAWLRTLHVHRASDESRGRSWEDELTKHVMDDITPVKHVVQFTMRPQSTKNLSKKAKRRMANMMLQESTIASHAPGEKNKIALSEETSDEAAIAALDCAETFLNVCGLFLKPATHKIFQERLVRECFNLDSYNLDRSLALLRCLEAARKSTSPNVPPPTQYCLQLYSVLINSRKAEISKFASQALLDIRLHLHCSPPSLNFAIEKLPEKKTRDDKRKRISERNRIVLESLLGAERTPSEDQEEVISIPDEPSSKKQRFDEDIIDKISVSSDSIQSVEIDEVSDASDVEISKIPVEAEIEETEFIESKEQTNQDNILNIEDNITCLDQTSIEEVHEDINRGIEVNIVPIIKDSQGFIDHIHDQIDENPKVNIDAGKKVIENLTTGIEQTKSPEVTFNIFEARTQVPADYYIEEGKEERLELSMEVGYDYPNTGNEKVAVIEKLDDENLPSTNDTDDLISCGQAVQNSQEVDRKVDSVTDNNVVDKSNEMPIENGIDKSPRVVQNGIVDVVVGDVVSVKTVDKTDGVTVEDMLADFVDEVNDEDKIIE